MLQVRKLPVKKRYECIGVLTSGGDAPGMNAAIRAAVRYGIAHGVKMVGIQKGYSGIFEELFVKMPESSVANIIQRGGTILKTDRCEKFHQKKYRKEAAQILRRQGVESLLVIGGDGSFTGAHLLERETGFPVMGVPGTIDNDISGTEDTIGFDTAVNIGLDAIDRIRDTASSHDRIFLVEVMGRNSGYIATLVGLGGGAETILIPEIPTSIRDVCTTIRRGIERGKTSSIIVVAEGPRPGNINRVAQAIEKQGFGVRVCVLGHIQRGGTPSAHDRTLASVLGASAIGHLLAGFSDSMIGVQANQTVRVPLSKVIGKKKKFNPELTELARILAI